MPRPHSILDSISSNERKALVQRLYDGQKQKCFICAAEINLSIHPVDIDHIKALSLGGSDNENNFALVHAHCNRSKGIRDLQLQKYIHLLGKHIKKYTEQEGGMFTVREALQEFIPTREDLHLKISDEDVILTLSDNNGITTRKYPILYDLNDHSIRSIVAVIPAKYVQHDESINPRSIVDLEPMIEEFYNRNPQLQPSLGICTFSGNEAIVKVYLFDGQHKAAAQLYVGNTDLFLRVFLNPDKTKLKETNFRAHTKLAQIHFAQFITDKVGYDIYSESFGSYVARMGDKGSERSFIEGSPEQMQSEYRGYLKNYLQYRVLTETADGERNKLIGYIETVSARSKKWPLSYETVQKTFFKFLNIKPVGETLQKTEHYRELEKNNLIKLMSMFAEEVVVGKFDSNLGIFKIEEQLADNPDKIPLPHLRAYRMCRASAMTVWTGELKEAIAQLLSLNNRYETADWKRTRLLWAEISEEEWSKIRKMIKLIADHKVWIEKMNIDIVQTLQSTRQADWKSILLDGKLPGREERVFVPIDSAHILSAI